MFIETRFLRNLTSQRTTKLYSITNLPSASILSKREPFWLPILIHIQQLGEFTRLFSFNHISLTHNHNAMKHLIKNYPSLCPFNKAIHDSFTKVLDATLKLLATVERHELRCYLVCADDGLVGLSNHKVFELISPLLYLSLESRSDDMLTIRYGFELFSNRCEYSPITSRFVRTLYSFTAKENTTIDIESSIDTDGVIYDCSALYETIEDTMRYYTLKVIPYKVAVAKRKTIMAVA